MGSIASGVSAAFGWVGSAIATLIAAIGYGGVVLLMAVESAGVPIPSEVIMPFAGSLAALGRLDVWLASLAGAAGCVVGSVGAYFIGAYGGRAFLERHGQWLLITRRDLDVADRWFSRHGAASVFWGRLMPIVRTYISFPAGISRMPFGRFVLYTFLGSLPWTGGLAYAGYVLGENWDAVKPYFHAAEVVVTVLLLAAAAWWVWRHLRLRKAERGERVQGPPESGATGAPVSGEGDA